MHPAPSLAESPRACFGVSKTRPSGWTLTLSSAASSPRSRPRQQTPSTLSRASRPRRRSWRKAKAGRWTKSRWWRGTAKGGCRRTARLRGGHLGTWMPTTTGGTARRGHVRERDMYACNAARARTPGRHIGGALLTAVHKLPPYFARLYPTDLCGLWISVLRLFYGCSYRYHLSGDNSREPCGFWILCLSARTIPGG